MILQRLLIIWAKPHVQHVFDVTIRGVVGFVFVGGTVGPVVTTIAPRHLPFGSKPIVITQPATKDSAPSAKRTSTPTGSSTPTAVAAPPPASTTPTAAAAPTPSAPAPTLPSPGNGAKTLTPTTTPPPASTSSPAASGSGTNSPATTGFTSTNWAGYVALAGGYTSVSASWKVPSPTGNNLTTTSDSSWIGIGGVYSNDLIQTGTMNTVTASGQVASAAFYELLPGAALLIPSLTVSPNDVMTATISESSANRWVITITNTTTGQTFSTTVRYASSHSSAEWIEEDPSYGDGSQVPFDSFGTTVFSSASVTANGAASSIAAGNGQAVTMITSSNQAIATPSVLNTSGDGFSVTRN